MFQFAFRLNRFAVVGTIAVGMAVGVSGFGIVRAEHAKPDATFSCSSGKACLKGEASGSADDGVYGSSIGNGTHGVYGTSDWAGVTGYTSSTSGGAGVAGASASTSGSGNGIYGRSSNGPGVYGTTDAPVQNAVAGVATVRGKSGVYGYSKGNGTGIVGESNDKSGDYFSLWLQGDYASNGLFLAYNEVTKGECQIDNTANLSCTGGVSGPAMRVRQRSSTGHRVLAYASETTSATIQDDGTARLFGGVANVQIDPAFASMTDHRWYYVFLTPLGDTRGLYVSIKTPAAFQVREAERGRDTLSFDYRIVAHPLDAMNDRLPIAPAVRRPPLPRHPSQ